MEQDKGVAAEKILFLPNGMDLGAFRPLPPDEDLRAELGLPHGPIILYTGTMGYTHGVDVALDAARLLQDDEVALVFVGGGSDYARLEQQALRQGLNNVYFRPSVAADKIPALYSLATAGLATLRDAPLFHTTRLAKIFAVMACAKPLLYSGPGEGGELAAKEGAALLTPAGDAQALAQAIRQLVNNPRQAQQMGERGRAFVERELQWRDIVTRWLAQLEDKA